jgi:Xaa-Pro dipeptidase
MTNGSKSDVHHGRLEKLRRRVAEKGLEGVVLVPGPNLRYLTGVNSMLLERAFLLFLPKEGDLHLVAPKLESGPYLRSPLNIKVHSWNDTEGPSRAFEVLVNQVPVIGKWGVEGRTPFRFLQQLQRHAHPELTDGEGVLQGAREIKEPVELRSLQRAASILSKSFAKIPNMLNSGITELELSNEVSQEIYSNGAEFVSDILVQSGPFAADPHHLPSTRRLRRNEGIVVDIACTYSGYYADITRTFIMGKDREFERLYGQVLSSQEAAIGVAKNGVTVGSIDNAARSSLKQRNLDQYFIHRTGHGLGLEVHEAPFIVSGGEEIVQPAMVFTVEPGVYIPGKIGVRIEDDVISTDRGCKILTRMLPKQFEWWK